MFTGLFHHYYSSLINSLTQSFIIVAFDHNILSLYNSLLLLFHLGSSEDFTPKWNNKNA